MNNLKKFDRFVNESLSDPTWIAMANDIMQNERLTGTIVNTYNSLNSRFKKILMNFIEKDTADLSTISKLIRKFNLVERFKSKKGDVNDKIEEVISEVGETNEEFGTAITIVVLVLVGLILAYLALLGAAAIPSEHGNTRWYIAVLVVYLVICGSFIAIGKYIDNRKETLDKTEKVVYKTIKMDGRTINVKIINRGGKITFEEVKSIPDSIR
jgi:hypothetical protein